MIGLYGFLIPSPKDCNCRVIRNSRDFLDKIVVCHNVEEPPFQKTREIGAPRNRKIFRQFAIKMVDVTLDALFQFRFYSLDCHNVLSLY